MKTRLASKPRNHRFRPAVLRHNRPSRIEVGPQLAEPDAVMSTHLHDSNFEFTASFRRLRPALTMAFALLTPIGAGACATTQTTGEQLDDTTINGRVGRALTGSEEVSRFDVDVDTLDGFVTLRGKVESDAARDRAGEIARDVQGVKGVHNEIVVTPPDPAEDEDPDAVLTARVKARLMSDPQVKAMNIDVDSSAGVVTLSGIVENDVAHTEAVKLAQSAEGVRDVVDQLSVGTPQ